MRRCLLPALLLCTPLVAAEKGSRLFSPPRRPAVPEMRSDAGNAIDAFILKELRAKGLTPTAEAERAVLLRRVALGLTGLPPTLDEMRAAFEDRSPDWYERVVDRLLASTAFGERMAQPWLDLTRYAESDGFKEDAHRPAAHRWRDWVVRAFNADMGYDRFVSLQLAGDELAPGDADALTATGFLRLYPDESNAANLEQRRQEILDDVTDVVGQAFLGLTIGCARCHDHKYDPTTQKNYFSLQAFLAPLQPIDEKIVPGDPEWEKQAGPIREEIERLLAPVRAAARKRTLERFRAEIQQAVLTPEAKRTPYQRQIAALAEKQLRRAENDAAKKPPADIAKTLKELQDRLAALPGRPRVVEAMMAVSDIGPDAPPTHRLLGGQWKNPREEVRPEFPEFLGGSKPDIAAPSGSAGTGRRSALARGLIRDDHPLTARVMVNRLWQHHFGVGLVPTSGDFGPAGEAPSHPDLLDWLARELIDSGWSLKHVHRLIVTSAAYRRSSSIDPRNVDHRKGLEIDRDNKLLWHAPRRRLEGEALRDVLLAVSGGLNRRMGGPSARPKLPEGISRYAWKPDPVEAERHRRSVYVLTMRNMRYPLFDAFDQPDLHNSCSRRARTTTAPQALLLLNGELTRECSRRWADDLRRLHRDDLPALVRHAGRAAWCRALDDDEVERAVAFIRAQSGRLSVSDAVADFCHAVMNANETMYVD